MNDQTAMLISAALIAAGLVYLGSQIGDLARQADTVVNSPTGRTVANLTQALGNF